MRLPSGGGSSLAGLSLSSPWCRLLLEAATLFRFGPFASRWCEAVAVKKEFLHKDRGRRPEHGSLRGLLPATNSWGLSRLVAKGTQPRPPQAAQRHPGGCRTGRGACAGEQPMQPVTRAKSSHNSATSQGSSSLDCRSDFVGSVYIE